MAIIRDERTTLGHEIRVDQFVDWECGLVAGVQGAWMTEGGQTTLRLPGDVTLAQLAVARAFMAAPPVCPHAAEQARRRRLAAAGVSEELTALAVVLKLGYASAPADIRAKFDALHLRATTAWNGV